MSPSEACDRVVAHGGRRRPYCTLRLPVSRHTRSLSDKCIWRCAPRSMDCTLCIGCWYRNSVSKQLVGSFWTSANRHNRQERLHCAPRIGLAHHAPGVVSVVISPAQVVGAAERGATIHGGREVVLRSAGAPRLRRLPRQGTGPASLHLGSSTDMARCRHRETTSTNAAAPS